MIYLDNASTTYPKPEEVYKANEYANRNLAFNSGRGGYNVARDISKMVDETRREVIGLVNGNNGNKVIFTSSATQSLNQIIFGLDWEYNANVYISPFEHNAVIRSLTKIKEKYNINIITIPFDNKTWELMVDDLEDMFINKKPKCIFISSKSNVTGYNIPYREIFTISEKYKSINVLDASQSFGIKKIDINETKIDYIVFAGHKSLYSVFGIAGFIKNSNENLNSVIYGGTGSDTLNNNMPDMSPYKYEAGSLNCVGIYTLKESIEWLKTHNVEKVELELTKYLLDKLANIEKVKLYMPKQKDMCDGIISINVDGYNSDEVGSILDNEFSICVRTGYHCAPYVHDFINSLNHLGTVRISLGYYNTKEDIDALINALKSL